jgi:hypothetical protein
MSGRVWNCVCSGSFLGGNDCVGVAAESVCRTWLADSIGRGSAGRTETGVDSGGGTSEARRAGSAGGEREGPIGSVVAPAAVSFEAPLGGDAQIGGAAGEFRDVFKPGVSMAGGSAGLP